MKILVVLTALAAVAAAGPTFRGDTDFATTKEKRSPNLGTLHHVPSPGHIVPVHQTYVQPIIPHHLGLKKPLIVHKPYGHILRSEEEHVETHSAEAKESKKTCMKEMETKCDDEIIAKSSELNGATKIEDIDGNVSDIEVEQSLRMAKEAVDTLQKKLELAEKNPRMTKWHHGQSEADGSMHENVETAKLALEHMQRNFGNLESMNVHARTISNAEVHDANLKLEAARSSDADRLESTDTAELKNAAELKSDEERLAQWKDAIENIQKNVELVRNIEDSFQHQEHSEKSAALEKSSSLNHDMSDDHKPEAIVLKEEKTSDKRTSDMKMAQDMEKKSTDGKSSWQAREHEESIDSKNEMETSASTLSESKTTLHDTDEQKVFRSESSHLVKNSNVASSSKLLAENARKTGQVEVINKPMELISQPSFKSGDNMEMKQAGEFVAPIVDTTTLMKSAESHQVEQHKEIERHSSDGHSLHKEHDTSSQLEQNKMSAEHHLAEHSSLVGHDMNSQLQQNKLSAEHHQPGHSSHMGHDMISQLQQSKFSAEQSSHMGHDMSSHLQQNKLSAEHHQAKHMLSSPHDHQKSLSSTVHATEALDKNLNIALPIAKEGKSLDHETSIPTTHGKEAHGWAMKASDQITGQSQPVGVAVKPVEHGASGLHSEKLHHSLTHGANGKSAEGGALFAPMEMNSGFKEALVPTKSWKEAHGSSRGAYGSGAALGGLGGSYGTGGSSYGTGSGAVGVFPSARVGGCAIPLLLSCSPNVVAGHLAKGHSYAAPSYSAPAYRGSESSSHSKRDITKISRPSKTKRTPTNKGLKQKTILIADKL